MTRTESGARALEIRPVLPSSSAAQGSQPWPLSHVFQHVWWMVAEDKNKDRDTKGEFKTPDDRAEKHRHEMDPCCSLLLDDGSVARAVPLDSLPSVVQL